MTSNGRNEEQVEEIFGQLVQVLLKFDQVQVQQWWGSERGSKKVQCVCTHGKFEVAQKQSREN